MKKAFIALVILVSILIILLLIVRFIIGGDEDTWLCDNGQWIKHGNPTAAQPTTGCGDQTNSNTTAIVNNADANINSNDEPNCEDWTPGACKMIIKPGYYYSSATDNCYYSSFSGGCSNPPFTTLDDCNFYCVQEKYQNVSVADRNYYLPNITTQKDCGNIGATWVNIGKITKRCELPTPDAGEPCTKQSDCIRECGIDNPNSTNGTCTEFSSSSCYSYLDEDGTANTICID